MNMQRWGAAVVAGVVVLTAAGCADAQPTAEAVTLTIGTDDSPGVPSADQIEEFAKQVAQISGGTLKIEPVWHAAGDTEDWDQAVARMVIDGELEMGLIPARAWDSLDVTSLQPLQAPFLITGTDHLDAVITSDLAEPLMAGLADADVVGLALFPEGMRYPFGFDGPVLGPADYAGRAVQAPSSVVSTRMFQVLGATTDDRYTDLTTRARESSFLLTASTATATGNVAFYPKVNVLVIGQEAYDGLDEQQRSTLRDAALATRDVAVADTPSAKALAKKFCASGGTIVHASAEDVAALRAATAPVVEEVAAAPGNEQVMAGIRDLAREGGDETVPECVPDVNSGQHDASIAGTYRYELTGEEFRDNGVHDEGFIDFNVGVYTWTFDEGEWVMEHVSSTSWGTDVQSGTYKFDGEELTMYYSDLAPEVYGIRIAGNGDLTLTPIKVAEYKFEVWATANTWERIG